MFGNKDYIGLTVLDDVVRIARIRVDGDKPKLVKLDQFSLVENVDSSSGTAEEQESYDDSSEEAEEADEIFGLEEGDEGGEEELDFEGLEDEADDFEMDMVDESGQPQTNELLIFDLLTDLNVDKLNLGLNIPAGDTIFQIIRDTDFSEVKKKDLVADLEEKLESIYGIPKTEDNYSYEVREDGSLLLASIEEESKTLQLVDSVRELYSGKITIESIAPDETALIGLVRANYELTPDEITGVIQFGREHCRVVFMKGKEIWLVSPIINEGTNNKTFLNTVFSKILFQLDTGEVPNLDRIILADNTIGSRAVDFFKNNFPDIHVENFSFKEDFFEYGHVDLSTISSFTSTIGAALRATSEKDEYFPDISFVPKYVVDRQKIFKLQWHGMLILFLIFLSPITLNYFYTQNAQKIQRSTDELNRIEESIEQLNPIVASSKELTKDLTTLKGKLTMLDTLTQNSQEWSTKLQLLNRGIRGVGSTWITSFSDQGSDGAQLQGYTLYRNRIPQLVNIFEEATLKNVNTDVIREQDIHSFSIMVQEFTLEDSLYSPPTPQEVKNLIRN